jgi:hypothetical protein
MTIQKNVLLHWKSIKWKLTKLNFKGTKFLKNVRFLYFIYVQSGRTILWTKKIRFDSTYVQYRTGLFQINIHFNPCLPCCKTLFKFMFRALFSSKIAFVWRISYRRHCDGSLANIRLGNNTPGSNVIKHFLSTINTLG